MLVRSIRERALGALFGGEQAANVFHNHLVDLWKNQACGNAKPLNLHSLRKSLQAAVEENIDERTGKIHRLNEIQQAAEDLCKHPFLDRAEILAFDETIDAILACDGGLLYFRDEQVQRYAEVLSELDPTLLVAWKLARRTELPGQDKRTLQEGVAQLTTLFVGPRFFSAPFAEGHVHLGGIAGDELVLAQLVLGHQQPSICAIQQPHVDRLTRIRRMLIAFTSNWITGDPFDSRTSYAQATALLTACPDDEHLASPNPTIDWDCLHRGIVMPGEEQINPVQPEVRPTDEEGQTVSARWLLQQLASAAATQNLQLAWIWLFILLWRTYRAKVAKPATRVAVLLLVADIMALRRQLMMEGSGLRRFTTQFFHSPLRKGASTHATWRETSLREAAQRLFARLGDKAEIKICASSLERHDAVVAFARAANAHIQALAKQGAPQNTQAVASTGHAHSRRHWHFCAHFNRVAKSSRTKLWSQAGALHGVLNSVDRWNLELPFGDYPDIGSGHSVFPAEVIRGLDVVGDETRWSIEIFAPMLRWLRHKEKAHPSLSELGNILAVPTPKLHLSIHAGEDYAHPLSGLRQVDETVRFCEMRSGDRLGHALALGIPPNEWLGKHSEVLLPVDEHVDNLVWAWREAVELESLEEARCVRPRLEERIARMLPYVSWYRCEKDETELTSSDLMRLYEAWELRRNCAHKTLEQVGDTEIGGSELEVGAPDLERLRDQLKNPSMNTAEGLYVHRARLEVDSPTAMRKPLYQVRITVLQCDKVPRRQQELESRKRQTSADRYLYDHDDTRDLRFMLALQDVCIERYAHLGLMIETNPSSNVYIGQLQTHSEHPIYRWSPLNVGDLDAGGKFNPFNLRNRPIQVTINTDDPGMIPTTLRMEHHLMHEAAMDHGHTTEVADEWIEQLRQAGMAHFENAH